MSRYRLRKDREDSGVAWLGSTPNYWQIVRAKSLVSACKNGLWGEEPKGDGTDTLCIRVADFDRDQMRVVDAPATRRYVTLDEKASRVVSTGDLLMEKSGGGETTSVGAVVRYLGDEAAICSNFVAVLRLNDSTDGNWCRYLFGSMYNAGLNRRSIKQTTGIQNIDSSQYLDERVAVPPVAEQIEIAAALDRETARIDALIAKKSRFIELLKEKRQALITHAVIKGLDPKVKMRDSGVEWIGEVPAHWEVKRIKHITLRIEQGWSPQCENQPAIDGEWAVLKVGCVNGGIFNKQENKALPAELKPIPTLVLKANDLLISRANTRELVGSAAVVLEDHPKIMLCDKLYRLQLDVSAVLPSFVANMLATDQARGQIELDANGASPSMVNIGQAVIREMSFGMPPIKEQVEIMAFVERALFGIQRVKQATERSIDLLKERRSALITAAVTGQIDLRETA